MTVTTAAPIDPLRSDRPGVYSDALVEVVRKAVPPEHATRTCSFAFWSDQGRVHLVHGLPDDLIDNDLAGLVAGELFVPGWLDGSELFERLLTGIVVSTSPDPLAAWTLFYRNTLDRLTESRAGGDEGPSGRHDLVEGSIAGFAPVYRRAHELIGPGTMLELGSCFGFFSLLSAGRLEVTASDLTPNTVGLLARVAPRLGRRLDTLVCDAARVPRPDASFDSVVALHLLEHLSAEHGRSVLGEMQRVARRRVVIAVPYEDEPTAAYGHVRVFDHDELAALGARSGWPWQVHDHHGGWLVLDRP